MIREEQDDSPRVSPIGDCHVCGPARFDVELVYDIDGDCFDAVRIQMVCRDCGALYVGGHMRTNRTTLIEARG